MKEEKINSFGLFTIIISITSSSFYGIYSAYIIHLTNTASLLSMVLGLIFGLLFSKIFLKLFNKKKNLSISNYNKIVYPKFNKVINIILIMCTFLTYIFLTYRLTTFLSNEYLIKMPNYLISILVIFITSYVASKGLETTIRVSTISFYISTIIFLFDTINLMPQVKLDNFLPLFNTTPINFIFSSLLFTLYFFVPIFNISFIKLHQIADYNQFTKYYYISIFTSFLISFISLFNTIGISGTNVMKLFDYPFYITLKRISLFSFLDSLENISIMLWLLYIINASSITLLSLFSQIKDTFNINKKKLTIVSIILIIISFLLPNILLSITNYKENFSYIFIPLSVLLIIFIIIFVTSKKDR